MNIRLANIAAVSLVAGLSGCQINPSSSEHINLGSAGATSGAMLETSYMCTDADDSKRQIISIFEDSRSDSKVKSYTAGTDKEVASKETTVKKVADKKLTLRLGDSDYDMTRLSKTRYISKQQNSEGQWLIWQTQPAALLSSKTADSDNNNHVLLCQVTR